MYATLTAAALTLAAAQPPAGQPGQPGSTPGATQPGVTPGTGGAAGPHSIDGTWQIVVLEKNGQPVRDAKNMTVSIRGNVVTFSKAGSAGAGGTGGTTPGTQPGAGGTQPGGSALGGSSELRAMRLDFGPAGTIRVMEADAGGKFGAGTTGTTGTTGTPGTGTPGAGTPGSSAGLGGQSGMKTGVYVLTQDYLAVCVHDLGAGIGGTGTGTTPGTGTTRPGTDRPGTGTDRDRPGADRPGAGTNTQPGGTAGSTAQPGGAGGTSVVGDGRLPQQRTYITVILRRDAGSRPAAAAGR